jgi:cysteine desulfuration protein SufE
MVELVVVNGAFCWSLKPCRGSIDNHASRVFLPGKLQRLLDEFAVLEDPHERLAAVVERAKNTPVLPPSERIGANRVQGCVSIVWLVGEIHEHRCYFRSDAESPVVRGLVAFLCDFFNGADVGEVATSDLEPLDALGVTKNLSPTRRHGLAAARQTIREFARRSLA